MFSEDENRIEIPKLYLGRGITGKVSLCFFTEGFQMSL